MTVPYYPIDGVDFENLAGVNFNVAFSENLSETEMRTVLVGLGFIIAQRGGE